VLERPAPGQRRPGDALVLPRAWVGRRLGRLAGAVHCGRSAAPLRLGTWHAGRSPLRRQPRVRTGHRRRYARRLLGHPPGAAEA